MKLVEARRYVLIADKPLEELVPEARKWRTADLEYTLPRREWTGVVMSLRGRAELGTLAIAAGKLATIRYSTVRTPFRRMAIPAAWRNSAILFQSPNLRRWRRVPKDDQVMWVRPGWCVLVKAGSARGAYYVVTDGPVTSWLSRPGEAINVGYSSTVGEMTLQLTQGDGVAIVPHWRLVLPPDYAHWLRRMCIVTEPPEGLWLWDADDLALVTTVLSQLHFRLRTAPAQDPSAVCVSEFLAILGGGYDASLATEEGVALFADRLRRRNLEAFAGTGIAQPLRSLMARAFRGEAIAASLLDYLSERLPLSYDWRNGGPLRAVALSSGDRSFGGRVSTVSEHLLAIPDLSTWATVRTTTLTPADARRQPHIEFTHYRLLPFFGRLRVTPGNDLNASMDAAEDVWRSLITLPTLEDRLSPGVQPYAYSISMLPWAATEASSAGEIVLERLIGSVARVLRRGSEELDLPSLLCEDATGTRFVLETHLLPGDAVPSPQSLIRFVARHAEGSASATMETYELVLPNFLSTVVDRVYWAAVVTAMVRMHLSLTGDEIAVALGDRSIAGLTAACEFGWLVATGGRYFFKYLGLDDHECRALWGNRKPDTYRARAVERLRPRIHPLFPWQFGATRSERSAALRFTGGPAVVTEQLKAALSEHGSLFVSALGRDRYTLLAAMERLGSEDSSLRFERLDDSVPRGGNAVDRTQFRVATIRG